MDFENEGLQALFEIAASVLVELPEQKGVKKMEQEEHCHFFKIRMKDRKESEENGIHIKRSKEPLE